MASPGSETGPGAGLSKDRQFWTKHFKIKTDLDVVVHDLGCTVGRLAAADHEAPAVDVISTTGIGPNRYRLLEPFSGFTELVLKLLEVPRLVEFTVGAYVPQGKAVTKAEVAVRVVRRDVIMQDVVASMLRKLYAGACSADYKRRQLEKVRPTNISAVELLPELVEMVIRKLPWKATFAAARRVSKTWRDAVDSVSPPHSYRRKVLEDTARKTETRRNSEAPCSTDRDLWPSVRWLEENRFDECSGEELMGWLEGGLHWLEKEALEEAFCRAAVGDGDGGEIEVGAGDGAATAQWRRLCGFLPGIRAVCEEHGILCGTVSRDAAAASRNTARLVQAHAATAPFGVRLSEAALQAAAAAGAEAVATARSSSAEDNHRWDGWRVFAVALALAASDDRPFLCRCALESAFGTTGLRRTQMIELICKMRWALRPPAARARLQVATAGFQAASGVSTIQAWDKTGSHRLWSDLLLCIFALEGYFVRFPPTRKTTAEGDDGEDPGLSQSSSISTQIVSPEQKVMVDESALTTEQREVVNTRMEVGDILKVVAYAGTGKTHTLRAFAQTHPDLKILYLVFTRSVANEAEEKFPRDNSTCLSFSQLAWQKMDLPTGQKLTHNLKTAIHAILKRLDRTTPYTHAIIVANAIGAFCRSMDTEINAGHVRIPWRVSPSPSRSGHAKAPKPPPPVQWVLETARAIWVRMRIPRSSENERCVSARERIHPTHDSIMKEYQLSKPDLSVNWDVIMLDEAQDINFCQGDIIRRQTKCRVILVGDNQQAIYSWRGARDYLKSAKSNKTLYLTQVFRFGNSIASVANSVLLRLIGVRRPLLGSLALSNGPAKVIFERERHEWLQLDGESQGRYVFIARTNQLLLREAIAAMARGDRVAFQDKKKSKLQDARDLCHLIAGKKGRVRSKELREIGSISALRAMLEEAEDDHLKTWIPLLNMVDDFMANGKTPEEILSDLDRVSECAVDKSSTGPLMILTTAHSAKGLDWDTVVLGDDFDFHPLDGNTRLQLNNNEKEAANLLYVAVTRAKRRLFLNPTLANQLRAYGMWDSLSLQGTTASDPLHPVPCCSYGCDCSDAHGVMATAADPVGVNDGDISRRHGCRFYYVGSGSGAALCRECVEGHAARGEGVEEEEDRGAFPYASQLLPPSRTA